jgi:hypothetical protein
MPKSSDRVAIPIHKSRNRDISLYSSVLGELKKDWESGVNTIPTKHKNSIHNDTPTPGPYSNTVLLMYDSYLHDNLTAQDLSTMTHSATSSNSTANPPVFI